MCPLFEIRPKPPGVEPAISVYSAALAV